jgi:uncharacterized membrane protein YdjX (TVP38/TMEM64 family)
MKERTPFSKTEIIGGISVAFLFIISAYLSTTYVEVIKAYIDTHEMWAKVVYIASAYLATVIAPISATPLIPIASMAWGPLHAALYSIIGWTSGSMTAFWLARKYGFKRIRKIVKLNNIQKYAERFPKKNVFWTVVLLRLVMPVDILSYAVGLFSTMTLHHFTLATLLGITPFAFLFSYAVEFPLWAQMLVFIFTGILVAYGYKKVKNSI